ncbi:sensor histidine kinase [[Actinomadura] parvosata]|uniref:sensor histidine kinase n=1 Tax=[Actinomadura] parvosata TaxID=1955412 RepID=UPI00164436C0|nr:sensor histidine kinase [Nonomuraea sp. ATCC 55076]
MRSRPARRLRMLGAAFDVRSLLMLAAIAWALIYHLTSQAALWSRVLAVPWALAVVALAGLVKVRPGRARYLWLVAACLGLEAWAGWHWIVVSTWATRQAGWELRTRDMGAISGAAVALALLHGADPGAAVVLGGFVLLPGVFARQSRRTADLIDELQETRRELARLAVVEERNRIARDLHDLVGHSLSVVAVKTELARRLVPRDPERAGAELADIDTVVRRALAEVRQAVTNYRQPALAAEVAGAVSAARSAGIACTVSLPDDWHLPVPVEGLLAWTVREGVTNVLRHSRARSCSITVELAPRRAAVEICDDGVGTGDDERPEAAVSGNGLTGLSERASALRGEISVGRRPEGGFRLSVAVPLDPS